MVQKDAGLHFILHEIIPHKHQSQKTYNTNHKYPKTFAGFIVSKVECQIKQMQECEEHLVPDFFEIKFSDERDKIRIEPSISQNDFESQVLDEIKSLGLENISPEVFLHYKKKSKLNHNKNEVNGFKDEVLLKTSSTATITSATTIPYSSTQSNIEGSDPRESTSTESNIWDPESGEFSTDSIKTRRGARGSNYFKHEEERDTILSNNTTLESSEDKKNLCNTNNISSESNHVGLVNQAMTCYLNSLLQALYMTPEFRNAMYKWEYKNNEKDSEVNSIPYQLQKLFLNLQTSHKTAVETTSLTKSFGWDVSDSWHQHDIQELCRVMFDALEQKFKNTAQADLINQLYEGKINDYVKCLSCNTEKSREDTFLDIPLPVRPFDNNVAYGSVEEALEAFVKYETLEGSNQYFCEKCDKKSDAHKGLKFTKFPYILTLQLKRFDFDHNTYNRIKLNDKVTFPETLNLNSFIEPSCKQESTKCEKDVENSKKDVNDVDKNCASKDSLYLNSNHLNNHEQDDKGVTMENGSHSRSCCTSYNEGTDILRKEYASSKGPYIYELFSIMIHSGSASGGHYYAYIKDFKNNKWYCFNDQLVSSITQEEIQKSYGGGTRTMYYSGVYRSSTNAYMLMYRQIDPERNTNPMEAKDFPPHIKKLLEKMKREEEQSYRDERSSMERRFKQTVYYRSSPNDEVEKHEVLISMNFTLNQVVDAVLKKTHLHYDNSECRIVTYLPSYNLVDTTFDGKEEFRLDRLFSSQHAVKPLLLDVRSQLAKCFESYPSEPIITKVYVIDAIDKELTHCSKYIRAFYKQTVREYKQELVKHFGGLDLNALQLYCPEILPNKLLDDDFVFDTLNSSSVYRITATDANNEDMTNNFVESTLYKMHEQLNDVITFYIDRKNVTKEQLDNLNIPSVTDHYRDVKNHDNIACYDYNSKDLAHLNTNSFNHYKSTISEIVPKTDALYNLNWHSQDERDNDLIERRECKMDDMCPKLKGALNEIETNQTKKEKSKQEELDKEVQTSQSIISNTLSNEDKKSLSRNNNNNNNPLSVKEQRNVGTISRTLHEFDKDKNEDWDAQETTNSEDSSLSDSDRTLVGDAPEDFNYDRYDNFSIAINPANNDVSCDKIFKIEHLRRQNLLKVSMDTQVTEQELKKKLETFLDIPKDYLKIVEYITSHLDDLPSITYSSSDRLLFRDDQKYAINLERILKSDEDQITVYFLDPEAKSFLDKLCTIIVKKNATMRDLKVELAAKLKKIYTGKLRSSYIPMDGWRLMEIVNDSVGTSIEGDDNDKILSESLREICIQEIVPRAKQGFTQIHAIKWNSSKIVMSKSLREEIKIEENADFMEQLKKQLSEATLISEENLEFYLLEAAKDIDLYKVETAQWKSNIKQDELDHKTHLLFRDSAEKSILLTDPSTSNRFNCSQTRNARLKSRGLEPVPVSSSPRKEKALKIRVGST